MPSEAKLRNAGGPAFTLRAFDSAGGNYTMPERGEAYDMREFSDNTTSVGHLYLHPGTRRPPIPPYAELQAFAAANPNMPIVVDHDRNDGNPCEAPHIVLATLAMNTSVVKTSPLLLDANNVPTIRLYTVAADHAFRAFDPATHHKNGKQHEGINILDWGMVNFDEGYQADTLVGTFRKIFDALNW